MALIRALPIAIQAKQASVASTLPPVENRLEQWIDVSLEYRGKQMIFPVTPDELHIKRSTTNFRYDILGQGQIVVPNRADLVEIRFTSIFWTEFAKKTAGEYLSWINAWRWSRHPARFVVVNNNDDSTYHGLNLLVLFEDMDTNEGRAGAEDDVYFSLRLIQWIGDEP